MNELTDRVKRERLQRFGSARSASVAGGISNTLWSRFERDGNVTDAVRVGVARAFGWPSSWPEQLPPEIEPDPDEVNQLRAEVDALWLVVQELAAHARLDDDDARDAIHAALATRGARRPAP